MIVSQQHAQVESSAFGACGQRQCDRQARATPWRGFDLHRAVELLHALLDAAQPEAVAAPRRRQADAVVGHRHVEPIAGRPCGDADVDPRRARVPDAVGQRLLDGPIDTEPVRVRELVQASGDIELDVQAVARGEVAHVPLERRLETEIVEHARSQPEREVAHGAEQLSTRCFDSATAAPTGVSPGGARALDSAELHPQRGEHLRDVIVQLARQVLALFLLRRDQLLRKLPHLAFGLLRALALLVRPPLEDAQPEHGAQRHREAEEHALPEQPMEVVVERGVPPGDFGALRVEVGVVQLLDLLRDGQHRLASRHDFAPQETRTPYDLLGRRPIEERIESLPSSPRAAPAGWRSDSGRRRRESAAHSASPVLSCGNRDSCWRYSGARSRSTSSR